MVFEILCNLYSISFVLGFMMSWERWEVICRTWYRSGMDIFCAIWQWKFGVEVWIEPIEWFCNVGYFSKMQTFPGDVLLEYKKILLF